MSARRERAWSRGLAVLFVAAAVGCDERLDVLHSDLPDDRPALNQDAGRPGCDTCDGDSLCSVGRCRARARVMALGAGTEHTCTVNEGVLWCFGSNAFGQLGQGDTTPRRTPTRVGRDNDWLDVSTGAYHSCGIRAPGTIYCWGDNAQGQLGQGGMRVRNTPMQVNSDESDYTAIACGGDSCCARHDDGTLACWGANGEGTAGINRTNPTALVQPTLIAGDFRYLSVSVGGAHACAIRNDRALLCWGRNEDNELGLGPNRGVRRQPSRVGVASDWAAVSAGLHHTCAINTAGVLHCWGANQDAQAGVGREGPDNTRLVVNEPVAIDTSTSWVSVAAGGHHTCARRRGGELFCWGRNSSGQVGLPPSEYVEALSRIDSSARPSLLALGEQHSCGLENNHALYCWGDNTQGQLGLGETTARREPTLVQQ